MSIDSYFVETPVGSIEILAPDDITACFKAREWFQAHGFRQTGYSMFRAPLNYVTHRTEGLIWVPLFCFVGGAL